MEIYTIRTSESLSVRILRRSSVPSVDRDLQQQHTRENIPQPSSPDPLSRMQQSPALLMPRQMLLTRFDSRIWLAEEVHTPIKSAASQL